MGVVCNGNQLLGPALADQQTIKRITVNPRKRKHPGPVPALAAAGALDPFGDPL